MRKSIRTVLALAVLGVLLVVSGIAVAAKPLGEYGDRNTSLQVDETGKNISSFNGKCTAVTNPKFTFAYFWGIPITRGKFHASHKNAVNTPDGGTSEVQYAVTIKGKFVSNKEAKGTYKVAKPGCKRIKFDVKLGK